MLSQKIKFQNNSDYTLVRVTKTTVLQRYWLLRLSLGLSTKSTRQSVFGKKK